MAFDGNGTFLRIMNWVQDAASAIKIKADRHDQQDDDFAAGLTNCITKDGQTQPTANLPMNGKKLVNLGDPTDDGDGANKKYVDAIKSFSKGLEISGADDLGRLKFTSTTGVNGLAFTGADLGWLARLADASATPPTKNRMVLNDKPDGTGTDVFTLNDDGSILAKQLIILNASASLSIKPTSGNGAVYWLAADGTSRMVMYTSSGAQSPGYLQVGGVTYQFNANGVFATPNNINAGGAAYQVDGNIVGTVWNQWGAGDAISAIGARIESRAQAWANDRIANLQYRKVSLGYNATSGGFSNIAGAVIVGYSREGGATGQVGGLYYMFLQVFDPVRGWVGFSG
jgi:hypothetical protein